MRRMKYFGENVGAIGVEPTADDRGALPRRELR
jgi:hypothetical protein